MIKILFIEDEAHTVLYMRKFFQMQGYEVYVGKTGMEGLELFKEKSPDVIFIDLGLPDIGGDQVLERIREVDAEVPIAVLTGNIEKEMKERVFSLGATQFFGKPCVIPELLEWTKQITGS